ncbi:MAG: hypothetical protein HY873_04475 [Chloroflexi bacterium]|nr:hypothetical protein [Chloroflexota bacterium]
MKGWVRRAVLLSLTSIAIVLVAAGCGDEKSPRRFEGSAAQATAQYWLQEAAGGRLPEGTKVNELGTQGIATLEVTEEQKDQGTKARVCVEFKYTHLVEPFDTHVRVYIATLTDRDEWAVEAVNPDGSCEGVV